MTTSTAAMSSGRLLISTYRMLATIIFFVDSTRTDPIRRIASAKMTPNTSGQIVRRGTQRYPARD
jgi:hypothetical protein